MSVPRFLRFDGYETIDWQTSVRDSAVYVRLEPRVDKPVECRICRTPLERLESRHRLRLKDLPLRGFDTWLLLWRRKGHCARCRKIRSEHIPFLAKESPHYTSDYTWHIGAACEFAPVSRVAELMGEGNMSVRRIDFRRMREMLKRYKIPEVTRIAVDEVYTRRKKRHAGEDRDQRFFTVITDLQTHRVVWVAESRKQSALDEFFTIIGPAACKRIEVVATDQHDPYAASVRRHCPSATVVWDKFHILQRFQECVNETRKILNTRLPALSPLIRLSRGKYRFVFLKKDERRTASESAHIDQIVAENRDFAALEIIKERMLSFFDEPDEDHARSTFLEIGRWLTELTAGGDAGDRIPAFAPLMGWWNLMAEGWGTLKNYFTYRVTSGLAEGVNNVIKALKRRAFGFRNMEYFRLKIMQACGYLNSRYVKYPEALGT